MTAIGPMIKPGMKAIGPMMISYYMDEYGYFQRKGKGKGKGKKGKKGKDDDGKGGKPGDGKGKSNYVQPQIHIKFLPYRINKLNKLIILLRHQVLVMVSFHLEELNHYVLMLERQSQHVLMF